MKQNKLYCTRCNNLLVATAESSSQPDRHSTAGVSYTFECQPCQLRFQVTQQEITKPEEAQDRRKTTRIPVSVPVDIECGTIVAVATVTDISKGGCAVQSQQTLTIGQLLRLKFPPPTGSVDNCVTQKIATVSNIRGEKIGVKFLAFTPEEQARLTKTVTKSIQFFPPSEKRS
ncbi:MAG: hypothetical protein A3H49_01270 [Nitrospirae bacterium RIFCSPLOWO2_02_FULL_62_14]|nr:MAG: hypothetical protein A3A88_03620 [Nitrospirae bacterium RIFCSPLOWO2_01_FULL_62_17]OGW68384.1 MAG: hypothetical protein A3H49_01270 [Nitrospirae bacterium RIFCSPLOWO2_02_FULL_62_14]OGX09992.1 MAG: hypothetical protein A3K11_15400 [Nitrospirae bacterium RIFCSPLOWO2_12_FULL_63_8]